MPPDNIQKYKKQSHSTYDCRYHVVFVTKYRFRIISHEIEVALKWIIKEICDWKEIEILSGAVKEEHVHLYLQIPPKHSVSNAMKWIKGKSAERLFKKFPQLQKQYWGQHLWARGYFVTTVGITDSAIRQYIQKQRQQELVNFSQIWKKR